MGKMTYQKYRNTFLIALIVFLFAAIAGCCQSLSSNFFYAINMVETSGRTGMIRGAAGEIGPMQISKQYWLDSRVPGHWYECTGYAYSCKVMTAYFRRFANEFVNRQDYEYLARIHNGGPRGYLNPATKKYWLRVRKYLTN